MRATLATDLDKIIDTLRTQALAGDAQAIRIILDRVLPALPTDGTLTDQGRAVVAAAGAGVLAPSQAAQLLAGLGTLAKLIETDELASRVAALESKHVHTKP
jgi:hypothetical protein